MCSRQTNNSSEFDLMFNCVMWVMALCAILMTCGVVTAVVILGRWLLGS